ncbi:hypothetical protein [Pantoea sp.]|uniref:hypothetical protein n=1 Tax=Pantoea sp. TaxID=69393 RepID=UPI0028999116|nr:hypothetical protein [Pantoea sp.]
MPKRRCAPVGENKWIDLRKNNGEEEFVGGEKPPRDDAMSEDNPIVLVRTYPFAISRVKHQHVRLRI